ncbi:MAG: ferritin-like domain-containing protein [Verrucomicrobiae bacterium]|nr:ferritin-like domain-containing protein [Verrucomicrobiae bacterium]
MKLENLHDLFVNELKDVYHAEKQLVKALPKIAKKAHSQRLRSAVEKHLDQTKTHVERVESVFEMIGKSPSGKTCQAMEGILEEGEELLSEKASPATLDAGIICGAQKVEHYEIATYGCLRTFANHLGLDKAAELLGQTLKEEEETDRLLTELAESEINVEATAEV